MNRGLHKIAVKDLDVNLNKNLIMSGTNCNPDHFRILGFLRPSVRTSPCLDCECLDVSIWRRPDKSSRMSVSG